MLAGFATPEGTDAYRRRMAERAAPEHFRSLDGCHASSIGVGTYLGEADAATDAKYREAVKVALARGANVIDTAVNYRYQRSERAVGAAIAELVTAGALRRDEVVVATKGGFIPFDGAAPADARQYIQATYFAPGVIDRREVVAGCHCIAPSFLMDQLDRSRANLGLDTIDVYYLHNPEMQLSEIGRAEFMKRLRTAFAALEEAVATGKIRRYGTATWSGYRQPPSESDHLGLADLLRAAQEVGGRGHHFKVIQFPYNLAMTEAYARATQPVDGETLSALQAGDRLGLYAMASASVYQGQLARNLSPVIAEFIPGLATDPQRAIQFVRSTPGIGTALVGTKTAAHVGENLEVARVAPLAREQFERLFTPA